MKKSSVFLFIICMTIGFNSCQKEPDSYQGSQFVVTNTSIKYLSNSTLEANCLKKLFKAYSKEMREFLLTNNLNSIDIVRTKEFIHISEMIDDLKLGTIEMFRSYGLCEKELIEIDEDYSAQQIAVMGLTFLAIETSVENKENNLINTKNAIDISYGKVMDCISRAFLGFSFSEAIYSSAGKIALEVAIDVVKRAAVRMAGVIGAIIVIVDFGDCIGLYDVW